MEKKIHNSTTKPNNKKGSYGPLAAVGVTLLAYFGSQLLGGVIVGSIAGLFGYDNESIKAAFESSVIWQFLFILVVEALVLLILWWFMSSRKISLKTIGLGRRPKSSDISYGLVTTVIYVGLIIVVLAVVSKIIPGVDLDQKQQLGFESATSSGPLALVFLGLVILPAIVEEIVVRGFLYTGLRSALPYLQASIFASLLFGVAHLQLGSGEPLLWVAAIDTFVLSMVLIELRERTGALWAGMLVHGLKNGVAFLALFVLIAP